MRMRNSYSGCSLVFLAVFVSVVLVVPAVEAEEQESEAFSTPSGYATVGTLRHDGKWEVGVSFDSTVDRSTVADISQYTLSTSTIESLRTVPETGAVILVTTNLAPTGNGLRIEGVENTSGNPLPPLNLLFDASEMEWVEIGTAELGFRADAVGVGEDGFDLISGGVQLWDVYDEATFAFREVTGNFDAVVRVELQDPSSEWARAGLMVREKLDANRPRPADTTNPSQAFSRYIDVHVNPVTLAGGGAANNSHEVNVRHYTGGIGRSPFNEPTENPQLSNNAEPAYPNAWLRIRRAGQSFTVYRGTDGVNWVEMGSFAFPTTTNSGDPVPPLPATLYVGPAYSPENGFIPQAQRRSFLAQFRDFSVEGSAAPAMLSISKVGTQVRITWEEAGVLQTSQTLEPNSWSDISGAGSPYEFAPGGSHAFYRLKQ